MCHLWENETDEEFYCFIPDPVHRVCFNFFFTSPLLVFFSDFSHLIRFQNCIILSPIAKTIFHTHFTTTKTQFLCMSSQIVKNNFMKSTICLSLNPCVYCLYIGDWRGSRKQILLLFAIFTATKSIFIVRYDAIGIFLFLFHPNKQWQIRNLL